MKTYRGNCHCGKVQFEIDAVLDHVVECNCSICSKKGVLHFRVPQSRFRLIAGESNLSVYRFNTEAASHYFCQNCGIHPFSRPRMAPDAYSINVRCLGDYEAEFRDLRRIAFDGRNWETAAAEARDAKAPPAVD